MHSRDDRTASFCSERMKICQTHLSKVYNRSKNLLVGARTGKIVPEITTSAARGVVQGQSNPEGGGGLSRFEKTKLSPYLNAVSGLFDGPSLLKRSQLKDAHTLLTARSLKQSLQPNCPQSCNEGPSEESVSVPLFFGETLTGHDSPTLASRGAPALEPPRKNSSNWESTADNWEERANGGDLVDSIRTTGTFGKDLISGAAVTSGITRQNRSTLGPTFDNSRLTRQIDTDRQLLAGTNTSFERDNFQSYEIGKGSAPSYLLNIGLEQTGVSRLVFPQPLPSPYPQSNSKPYLYRTDANNMKSRPHLPLTESHRGTFSTVSQTLQIAPSQSRALSTSNSVMPRKIERIEARQLAVSKGIVKTPRLDLSEEATLAFRAQIPELLAGNELMLNEDFTVTGDGDPLLLASDSQPRLTSTKSNGHYLRDSPHTGSDRLLGPKESGESQQISSSADFQKSGGPSTITRDVSPQLDGQIMLGGQILTLRHPQTSRKNFSEQKSGTHSQQRIVHKMSAGNLHRVAAEESLGHKANLTASGQDYSKRLPSADSLDTVGPGTARRVSRSESRQAASRNRRKSFGKMLPDKDDEHQKVNASSVEPGAFASRLSTKSSNTNSVLQASVSNFFGVASGHSNPDHTLTVQQFHDAICDQCAPDCPSFRIKNKRDVILARILNQEQIGDRDSPQPDAGEGALDPESCGDATRVNGDEKCAQYNYGVRTDMRRQEKSSATLWKYGNMAVCTEDPRKDYLSGEVPPTVLEMAGKRKLEISGVHWSRSGSRKVVNHVCQILRQNKWGKGATEQLNAMRGIVNSHCVNSILQQQKDPNVSLSFFNWAKSQKGYKHDVFAFTTMINILGRARNLRGVRHLLENMHDLGIEPTVATYNTLILCYGRVESLSESLRVFRIMQEAGCKPDNVTYSILIHLCIKAGYLQEGLKLYQSMREAGVQPDTITYSIVIDSLGKSGNLREARKLFREMKERGYVPNEFTYNSMIDRHAKACKTQRALKFFAEMRLAGFKLNAVVCTTMMGVLGSLGKYDEAESLFSEMQQAGIVADTAAYGLMINIWGNAGNLDKAVSWYGRMLGNLVTPSLTVFGSLVNAHLEANLYEAAQHFLTSMGMWGISADLKLYTILLRHCTVCEKQEHADAILGLMDRLGHPAHRFLYELLTAKQQDKDSIRSRIISFLEVVEHEDQESLQGFANALVEFLHKLQCKTDPGFVWEIALEKGLFPSSIVRREAPNHWLVDLHSMCIGTALVALPKLLVTLKDCWVGSPTKRVYIVTGWGRRSRITGTSALKQAVSNLLEATKSPFSLDSANAGVFVSYGPPFYDWISRSFILKKLEALGSQGVVVR